MAQFIEAAEKFTLTENGAITNRVFSSKDSIKSYDGRMGVFFHLVRGVSKDYVIDKFKKASEESLEDTLVLLFHLRDCRGGKGERELFYWAYEFLSKNINSPLYKLLPEYGRMDEFVMYAPISEVERYLESDYSKMMSGEKISLLAKWMPTEGSALDKKYKKKFKTSFVEKYCNTKNIKPKDYRKKLTEMRSYLNIVERLISSGKWNEVEYSKVPSKAMNNLKKAFEKHDPERFKEYISSVQKGEQKINAGQLFPHELLNQVHNASVTEYDVIQAQWDSLVKKYKTTGCPAWVPVCDVSGSMTHLNGKSKVSPIDVCVAMGLFLTECLTGPFKNKIITFSEKPTWHNVENGNLISKVKNLKNAPWGMNTDLYKTFELLASIAQAGNVTEDQMPGLIIFSDMQFDVACSNINTNFQLARLLFKNIGHSRLPKIVFWNLSASCLDFPVTEYDENVGLVSGFSPALMNGFLESGNLSPIGLIRQTLDSKRYDPVKKLLKET